MDSAANQPSQADGSIAKTNQEVMYNCGNGLTYPALPAEQFLDRTKPSDYNVLKT